MNPRSFHFVDMKQEAGRIGAMMSPPMFGDEDSEGSAPAQWPRQAAPDANPRCADEDSEGSAPALPPWQGAPDAKPRRAGKLCERPTPYSKTKNADIHFVDLYREQIIAKTKSVMPILVRLECKGLVTSEKFDEVKAEKTTQAQMRELYSYIRSWGSHDKDIFFDALLDHEEPLIRKLLP